jgi:hypothetical protein
MKLQHPIQYLDDGAETVLEELVAPTSITLGQLRKCDQDFAKDRKKWCIPLIATVLNLTKMQRAGLALPDALQLVGECSALFEPSEEVPDFSPEKIKPVESLLNRAPDMEQRPFEFLAIILQYGLNWKLDRVNSTSLADAMYMLPEVQARFLGNSTPSTVG